MEVIVQIRKQANAQISKYKPCDFQATGIHQVSAIILNLVILATFG